MNVLISVRQQWWNKIKAGEKLVELRKIKPTRFRQDQDRVFFYISGQKRRIVANVEVTVHQGSIEELWDGFGSVSGMDREGFFQYYGKREQGYVYEFKSLTIFENPVNPKEPTLFGGNFHAPQSILYLEEADVEAIRQMAGANHEVRDLTKPVEDEEGITWIGEDQDGRTGVVTNEEKFEAAGNKIGPSLLAEDWPNRTIGDPSRDKSWAELAELCTDKADPSGCKDEVCRQTGQCFYLHKLEEEAEQRPQPQTITLTPIPGACTMTGCLVVLIEFDADAGHFKVTDDEGSVWECDEHGDNLRGDKKLIVADNLHSYIKTVEGEGK